MPGISGMLKFFIILRGTMSMPKERNRLSNEGDGKHGRDDLGLFILLVTVVLERESFFS